eukprot:scaffold12845_cov141-Skeletonema_marinoi.AAC.3
MGKSKRTSSRNVLETLAAELWVREVNDAVKSRYADSNGVAMVCEDHQRKESRFQVGVAKSKIDQLMKGNNDEEDFVRSKSITFLKDATNDEGSGKRCAKDYLRAIAANIDPNYKEKTMARAAGLWSGYFGDRDICDDESVELIRRMPHHSLGDCVKYVKFWYDLLVAIHRAVIKVGPMLQFRTRCVVCPDEVQFEPASWLLAWYGTHVRDVRLSPALSALTKYIMKSSLLAGFAVQTDFHQTIRCPGFVLPELI